jgi:hypothetical protein
MSLSHGETTVEINGEVYELRPSLGAMKKINARFGGLRGALEALQNLNIESVAAIIAAGAGLGAREANDVTENVFAHGIADATEQVFPFIEALFNPTGKKAEPETSGKKAAG